MEWDGKSIFAGLFGAAVFLFTNYGIAVKYFAKLRGGASGPNRPKGGGSLGWAMAIGFVVGSGILSSWAVAGISDPLKRTLYAVLIGAGLFSLCSAGGTFATILRRIRELDFSSRGEQDSISQDALEDIEDDDAHKSARRKGLLEDPEALRVSVERRPDECLDPPSPLRGALGMTSYDLTK